MSRNFLTTRRDFSASLKQRLPGWEQENAEINSRVRQKENKRSIWNDVNNGKYPEYKYLVDQQEKWYDTPHIVEKRKNIEKNIKSINRMRGNFGKYLLFLVICIIALIVLFVKKHYIYGWITVGVTIITALYGVYIYKWLDPHTTNDIIDIIHQMGYFQGDDMNDYDTVYAYPLLNLIGNFVHDPKRP